MRKPILTLLAIIGVLAFSLYATIGESGPIGWLNAAQVRNDGSYSRTLSVAGLLFGIGIVVMVVVYIIEFLQKVLPGVFVTSESARAPAATAASAPARATFAPPTASTFAAPPAKPPVPAKATGSGLSGWRLFLTVWFVFNSLVWGCLFAWYGWEWHERRADVVSTYAPLPLSRDGEPAHPGGGSHLALQGAAPLWEHVLTRRSKNSGSSYAQAYYMPVATTDWRSGDPVHFVARFDREQQLDELHRAAVDDAPGTVLVRVGGGVDAAVRPAFERNGVLVADDAVEVTAVPSHAGRPTQVDPPFDWMNLLVIGIIISGLATVLPLAGVLGLKREQWMERRRAARAGLKKA